jgi:hypothetical protein
MFGPIGNIESLHVRRAALSRERRLVSRNRADELAVLPGEALRLTDRPQSPVTRAMRGFIAAGGVVKSIE